jgi:LAO/AO transport system kinase
MKAGIMEIADVFVINKADRPGAKQLRTELASLLTASPHGPHDWIPPIVSIGNLYEPEGFAQKTAELMDAVAKHHAHLIVSGQLAERTERKAVMEITDALRACILEPVIEQLIADGELKKIVRKIQNRETDPFTEAEAITRRFLKTGETS